MPPEHHEADPSHLATGLHRVVADPYQFVESTNDPYWFLLSTQIGAGLGTAWLTSLAAAATASYGRSHPGAGVREAAADGYASAALVAAGALAVAAVIVWFIAGSKRPDS